ncbi:MAG: S8 family serine peptidase, partial [Vicinamibacterales bacterium]
MRTTAVPNDPQFGTLWGLRNTGQSGGTAGADIRATEAWNLTTGSSNVVVAVIDTGIDPFHQDLAANVFQNTADCNTNGVDDDGNGFVDDCNGIDTVNHDSYPFDDNGHGTHTAGTIGAVGNNSIGVVGVNWTVRLMACKFLDASGSGSSSNAIACLDYVALMKDRGVNIVASNNSWGGGGFSQALYDAIDAQRQRGILFIASAGNGSLDSDRTPQYPAGFSLPNVIAVAATTRTDGLASFSNYGKHTVHLGAPGDQILSTTPGNTYNTLSGTSMAAPHVTGVAALLKAQDPSRDWRAIKNLMLAGGDQTSSLANTVTGRRLNALNALTCSNSTVLSRLQPTSPILLTSAGALVTLSALHINCANPNGSVTVTVNPGGSTLTLLDNGTGVDLAAGDGIYSAQWAVPSTGSYTLTFPGGDVVTVASASDYTVEPTVFNYRTIAGTNLNLGVAKTALITSPFPILLGGNANLTQLFVGSNGTISFDTAFTDALNGSLPTFGAFTLIAPLWDGLHAWGNFGGSDGNVFWAVTGSSPDRELVIEWRNVEKDDCLGTTVKFQVVFFEGSSKILFNYADTTFGTTLGGQDCSPANQGASATVGVQLALGRAELFSVDQADVADGSALLWTVGGAVPFSIVSGGLFDLAAGASQVLSVRFSPTAVGTVSATVDVESNGGNLSASLTGIGALVAPTIVTQPISQTVDAGQNASFTTAATGTPTYQWQVSTNGGSSWTSLTNSAPYSGVTTTTLTVTNAPVSLTGARYRVVATNAVASATSNAATLTVVAFTFATYDATLKAPKCGPGASGCDSGTLLVGRDTMAGGAEPNQPNTILNACSDGTLGIFHVDESNDRIRISTLDGTPFATGKTVRIDATVWVFSAESDDLYLYYSSNPSAPSPTWTFLTVLVPPATGARTLSATYTLPSGSLQAVRAAFRFGSASITNGCASGPYNDHDDLIFSVSSAGEPIITTQPANQTVAAGTTATFTVAASGTPTPTYQWQVAIGGGAFTDLTNTAPYSGVTTTALTITGATAGLTGNQYRAVATNSVGTATSTAATLTVTVIPVITTPPANQSVGAGATATFTVAASGTPTPTYQWQVAIGGGSFTDLANTAPYSGVTTTTLTVTSATVGLTGNQYRAVATNSAGTATSTAATLTVTAIPVITTQPTSQTVAAGATATFSVAASGTPTPTYQWQVAIGGGAFTALTNVAPYSGVTTATLTVTSATVGLTGNQYRAVATNSAGSATSNSATLIVATTPVLTVTPGTQDFGSVQTGSFTNRTFTVQNTGSGTLTGSASIGAASAQSTQQLDSQQYVEGRLLVKFRARTSISDMTAAHAAVGAQRIRTFGSVSNLELVRLAAGANIKDVIKQYSRRPDVLYVEPDYIVRTTAVPNDPQFGTLWGLRNTGQSGGTAGADIR